MNQSGTSPPKEISIRNCIVTRAAIASWKNHSLCLSIITHASLSAPAVIKTWSACHRSIIGATLPVLAIVQHVLQPALQIVFFLLAEIDVASAQAEFPCIVANEIVNSLVGSVLMIHPPT